MDPIPVPAPPRSAYNENRRISDLIHSQIKHLQHVEMKRGDLAIDPAVARNIHTEAGAAQYIAAVTKALAGKSPARPKLVARTAKKRVPKAAEVVQLAASAGDEAVAKKAGKGSKAGKGRR